MSTEQADMVASDSTAAKEETPAPINPIPMSFPAALRNSKLSGRLSQIREESLRSESTVHVRRKTRDDKDGKRWIRRQENARFVHNPHVIHATKRDYILDAPQVRSTFPTPLPPYLPRTVMVPSTCLPAPDAASANAGRFSLGLKGMRRDLRRSGARAETLVREIETELVEWLVGGTILLPDGDGTEQFTFPGKAIGSRSAECIETGCIERKGIWEISKTPLQLVWSIENDAFTRYVAHCCARYHSIVSFSKDVDGRRLTYFLRPNVTRPDHFARSALDTPPATDVDYSSLASAFNSGIDSDSASVISIGVNAVAEESDLDEKTEELAGSFVDVQAFLSREAANPSEDSHSEEEGDLDSTTRSPRSRARLRRRSSRLRAYDISPIADADVELALSDNLQHMSLNEGADTLAERAPTRNSARNDLQMHGDMRSARLRPDLQSTALYDNLRRRTSSPSGSRSPVRRPARMEWSRPQRRKQDGGRPTTLYDYIYS